MHASVIIVLFIYKVSDTINQCVMDESSPFQRSSSKKMHAPPDANVSNNAVTDLPFSATNQFFEQWILKKDK